MDRKTNSHAASKQATGNNNGSRFSGNHYKVVRNGDGKNLCTLGDNMCIKLTGQDTLGLYALVEQHNHPGAGIPMHVHENEDEVFKVIEGIVEFTLDQDITVLKAGDLIFCPRGIPHKWQVVGPQNAKVDLGFFPAGMEMMFEELSKLPQAKQTNPQLVNEICRRYGIRFV